MSLAAATSGAPEAKKLRLSLPTQVVVQRPIFGCHQESINGGNKSPVAPSALQSLSSTSCNKEEIDFGADEIKPLLQKGQSFVDVLSTAMMFQANALLKQQQQQQQQGAHGKGSHNRTPKSIPSTPPGPAIPGALAVAASPAAALFGEDDWSWHRNPAAAIRSGGTNKQTPVWKYFVYSKSENISRCIVGDCSYMLKGPHTSTLACHLKKHPVEYAEFQKLKIDYTRDRNGGQLPPSPASSTSGSGSCSANNSNKPKQSNSNYMIKTSKINDTSLGVLNLSKQSSPLPPTKHHNHSVSSILNVLNARASAAALASGNAHLLQNPATAPLNHESNSDTVSIAAVTPNGISNNILKHNGYLNESLLAANLLTSNGLLTANGMGSRKWGRDDRKQKEMETKLALMLSATQLPLSIVENSFFREFIEASQPKFNIPPNASYIEETLNTQQSRTIVNLKNQLSIAKRIAVMVDVLKLATPSSSTTVNCDEKEPKDTDSKDSDNSDSGLDASSDENPSMAGSPRTDRIEENRPIVRLCVSAAYFSTLAQRMEVALLGVRMLNEESSVVDSVRRTVEQVLSDFEVNPEKVSRYITNGVLELIENDSFDGDIFPKMLEPYNQKLTQSLLNVIEANGTINELKKSFYSMILNFVTRPDAASLLQEVTGRIVSLPITDSFLVLIDAVLELKDAFLKVCSQLASECPIDAITEEQWRMLEGVSRLLRLFRTHMNVVQDGVYATIDGVVPSLMQLQLSLDKDFSMLGDLPGQLKADLQKRTASILDMKASDFDGSFIQATALNHHLALLLDDEQIAYAKDAIEKQLNERMRAAEESLARRNLKINGGVDALLAAVVDRNSSSSASPISSVSGNSCIDGSISPGVVVPPTALYPDLVLAANERRKVMQERQQSDGKNRYAEAIVQSYFDELACGEGSQATPNSPLSLTHGMSSAMTGRQLPPLQFWQLNATKCGHLAEIATELLTIPSSTVSLERIFATSSLDSPDGTSPQVAFDPISLLKSIEDPVRMERDAMLRFNRALIPKI